MSFIVDNVGERVIVVATLEDGVKIALDTREKLAEFFAKHPSSKLNFIKAKEYKK
jgi:hypothetical protein